MHYKQTADRCQMLFFSSLDSFISDDNLVRLIDVIIDKIIDSNPERFIYKGQDNIGQRSYSPSTMLKLYVYGYLNGISSSRRLEVETHRNIEVKWLLGDLQPDFKTIADYRKDNRDQIGFITREFRRFLKAMGYIKGEKVAIDGTKVKANTNRSMLNLDKIEKRMSNLDNQLERYLEQLKNNDIRDDLFDDRDDTEPDLINKQLMDKIASLHEDIERLELEKRELKSLGKRQISKTDKEASLMKSRDGKIPAYNVQALVDSEYKMIAEAQVSGNSNDSKELSATLKKYEETFEDEVKEAIGDKGYYNPKEIKKIEEEKKTRCFIAVPRSCRDKEEIEFTYDREKNEYLCSEGKRLLLKQKDKLKRGRYADAYQGIECDSCSKKSQCTRSKKGRIYHRYHDQEWQDNYKRLMKSSIAIRRIKERKSIIEHVFGTLKYWMGEIPLLLRGKEKVQTEINLYSTAYNLKRLIAIDSFESLIEMINRYNWKVA